MGKINLCKLYNTLGSSYIEISCWHKFAGFTRFSDVALRFPPKTSSLNVWRNISDFRT